jgi:hypothetical protein
MSTADRPRLPVCSRIASSSARQRSRAQPQQLLARSLGRRPTVHHGRITCIVIVRYGATCAQPQIAPIRRFRAPHLRARAPTALRGRATAHRADTLSRTGVDQRMLHERVTLTIAGVLAFVAGTPAGAKTGR